MMLNNDIPHNRKAVDLTENSLKYSCPRISRLFNFVFNSVRGIEQVGELCLLIII